MNMVAPYCECPQCSYWGLHLMAEVEEHAFPRVLITKKPKGLLGQEIVYTKAAWIVRECIDCSHRFLQHWKEWNDW